MYRYFEAYEMQTTNLFFQAVGIDANKKNSISCLSKATGISIKELRYYNDNNIVPTGRDMEAIVKHAKKSNYEIMIAMGILDSSLIEAIRANPDIITTLANGIKSNTTTTPCELKLKTELGMLYKGDCLDLMRTMDSNSIDVFFADPPFNLNKIYPSNINDNLKKDKYLKWCEEWIEEGIRITKNGGSFFIWNLPKWNSELANYLNKRLNFKNWISVDIKYSLPIKGRLYPSNYSLLYYVKGEKPNTFNADRLPMQTCPHCHKEVKDYGGYKRKMNPKGINLSDVWLDIPPVRHTKYKRRNGANELSLKLLDRIIEMSSKKGDLVFDPFGGSGTTYMVAELKKRKWLGVEIGETFDIEERFNRIDEDREILNKYRDSINSLFPQQIHKKRTERGLWTPESLRETEKPQLTLVLDGKPELIG